MSESNIPKLENDYGLKFDEVEKTIEKVSLELEYLKAAMVGSSRVDLQACKLEYSIVSPK